MEFRSSRLNMLLAALCAFSLILNTANSETVASKTSDAEDSQAVLEQKADVLTRRQDNGFNLLNYFINRHQQPELNQQQAIAGQQQLRQAQVQQPSSVQHQHQLQQQQLAQQQLQQQQELQQLQQQQLLQLQQQQQAARSNDVYQDEQQAAAVNREGGYGPVGIGGGYPQQPKQIGISIGAGKPPNVIGVGNILTLLPRIMNVLSAGGKVMFGVELGNNFYFGPVGAKPLYG